MSKLVNTFHPARRMLLLASAVLLAGVASSVPAARTEAETAPIKRPDQVVIVSTTDVKGKTSPCGCHIPKGGFSRRASFMDSLRADYSQAVLVDAGGWFPEGEDDYKEVAVFQAEEMVRAGVVATGVSPRELHYGLAFLRATVAQAKTPVVSANLVDKVTGKLVFPPYRIVKSGNVTLGIFSLIGPTMDLGPARDSVKVADPYDTAKKMVAELRGKGVHVVVLLADMGKVDGEDLVTAIDGVDALVTEWNIPLLQRGRVVKGTVVSYGGDQGNYVGVTKLTLDAKNKVTSGENSTYALGPDLPETPEVLARVKAFEDAFNEHQRDRQKARAAAAAASSGEPHETPQHYVGAEVCGRCHAKEYAQWKTTDHSRAWQTLVDNKKDSTPDCVGCHTVGYQKPGGFQTADDAAKLGNVQCENCHGMGTEHDSWPIAHNKVPETTCRGCHTETTSPLFDFAVFRPHILHQVPASMPPLPPKPKVAPMMMGH